MRKQACYRWSFTVAASLALQACGGGGGGSSGENNNPVVTPSSSTAHAQGVVYDADTGQPLRNVTVQIDGKSVTTDIHGEFDLEADGNQSLDVRATLPGYAEGQARMDLGGKGGNIAINLAPVGKTSTLSIATGGTVGLSGSTAQVTLPAAGLVDASSGDAATGNVKVTLTAIDPAAEPGSMPGGYLSSDIDHPLIESFGAIQVKLNDVGTGKPLQLASGQTATIRIPVKTRSADLPASIPLYYLKDSTGRWVQEGNAQLRGDATSGYYYEGQVSHFSTWNADRPIAQTVVVEGCVRDASGHIPAGPVTVTAEGLDYSAQARVNMDAEGGFTLPIKRMARARLSASTFKLGSPAIVLEPATDNIRPGQCLTLGTPPAQPVILQQPMALTPLVESSRAVLSVSAQGPGPLRYQWRRNGENLPGQNMPTLALPPLNRNEDNGAKYSVVIRNGANSVTSSDFTLNITPLTSAQQQLALKTLVEGMAMVLPLSISAAATVRFSLPLSMLPPDQVCATGTIAAASLDGGIVRGGEVITLEGQHEIQTTFSNCMPKFVTLTAFNDTLSGSVVSTFFFDKENSTLVNTAKLVALTDVTRGLRVSGSFASGYVVTGLLVTPTVGATITHLGSGGGPDNTLTFTGGNMVATLVLGGKSGTVTFQDLSFTVGGVGYVLSGSFSLPGQATDEVVLKSGGKPIAQMLFDESKGGQYGKVTGTLPAF